jgi:hypothetical protein
MVDTCAGDCGGQDWRFCPLCGLPLRIAMPPERRRPTVGEVASLRAKGLTYSAIGRLFGYAGPGPAREIEARAMHDWLQASSRRLGVSYCECGGPLRRPAEPAPPWSWDDREALDAHETARCAYAAAKAAWDEAVGVPTLYPILRAGSVAFWRAAAAGELPGPIPRWPEAA